MIDILFLSRNRREFTRASLSALLANTNWNLVRELYVYDDFSTDGTTELFADVGRPFDGGSDCRRRIEGRVPISRICPVERWGSPVAIMNVFMSRENTCPIFCKLDSDVICPPGWLDAALPVMESHPELDLLGIEPPVSRTASPWPTRGCVPTPELDGCYEGFAPCDAIGGVGLMRRSAFAGGDLKPNGMYGGFTAWQLAHPEVRKGWIVPPLKVFLLDRLPIPPWSSLSRQYIAAGEQRPWTNYDPKDSALWEWWLKTNPISASATVQC